MRIADFGDMGAPGCSRRDLLKLGVCSSLVTALPVVTAGCGLFEIELEDIAWRLVDSLNHNDRAREIGHVFMAEYPAIDGQSYQVLTRELLGILELDPDTMTHGGLDALHPVLSEQIRRDFLDENVVTVGAWMLSRTEALLCALATAMT